MAQRNMEAQMAESDQVPIPRQIPIEVVSNGETRRFSEPAPEGFPPELFTHLVDFFVRGYKAASNPQQQEKVEAIEGLEEFYEPPRGRPADPETQRRGMLAWQLHSQGLTYGKIALELCPDRTERHHRCRRKCADRLRQEANDYKNRRDIEELRRQGS